MKRSHYGFSLVEIAIALVVIALIASATLKSIDLLQAAKLRGVIAQLQQHKTSLLSFKEKYQALPGDYQEASIFWQNAFNGNHNGKIEHLNTEGLYEGYAAWQHLSLAHMISGSFSGNQQSSPAKPGIDIPSSPMGGGFFLSFNAFASGDSNSLVLGTPLPTVLISPIENSAVSAAGLLTPSQMFELDSKIDDSYPEHGFIRGIEGSSSVSQTCVKQTETGKNIYHVTLEGKDCIAIFNIKIP